MNYIIYEGDSAATTVGVERPRILTQNLNSTFILLKCHFMTLLFQVTLHEQTNKMLKFYVLVLCINSRGCLFIDSHAYNHKAINDDCLVAKHTNQVKIRKDLF